MTTPYTASEDKMHGSMFVLLRRFIENHHGYSGWANLTEAAGIENASYQMFEMYPTSHLFAILEAAASKSDKTAHELLESYGEFLVPDLLMVYKKYVKPEWRTYEMLLYTEHAMHGAVKLEDNRTNPPKLLITKKGPKQLIIDYHSHRKMAAMAIGIIKGIAKHYQESDLISVTMLTPANAERVQIKVDFEF
ncbi:heme NO-binding domain-containing protein [Pontibacter cellulosilyticus]|uniref:Heme NO-binding domain-containing protein n=1 Tax=Pontibacter cellulosilyticus TaxID=1720253 RepID=A0A923NCQ6_9BACT|nr:heme NO-binding domain-containing protein [Pontibacter cellulosilyticus]MBC5994535.1 heme NO-binding domain-containing protein [Pontibacter cellulosilyticus]